MIEGLQPYSEYNESEQKWLGRIPAHWSLLPNRALFEEVKDRNHPNEEMLSVTITRGIIQQKALLTDTSKKDSSNVNKGAYKLVQPGDIAYNKMRAWQGAVGASSFRGIISPAYVVMRPRKDCTPWYYHHLYRTPSFAKEAERWSYGITSDMWSLRPEHFKVIYSVQPPPDEQAAIVRFLEHANQKIDGFIRAKRKLIGLLNEQKQAIIHRAVTRGLDPHATLKPSGIPWLGDIPQEWTPQRLKNVCRIRGGYAFKTDSFRDAGVPVIRMSNLRRGRLDLADAVRIAPADCVAGFELKEGDVLYGLSGSIGETGSLGNFAVVRAGDMPAQLNQRVARFRPEERELLVRFLVFMLQTSVFYDQVLADTTGTAQFNVSTNDVGRVTFALPSTAQQTEICDWLDTELSRPNELIARTEREIALMQEYRTRLTADVVTGKLDVRPAAAHLPDSTPETATEAPDENEREENEP
ncbi:MAG: restriction endonuclease subunit S [Candidatus Methylacidiphilales bacterium]|nr:restriction endonuclease subunit S [Candidatus Methylacidiphilales bacterium]